MQTLDVVVPVLDAGCDWVTFTEPLGGPRTQALWQCAGDFLEESCKDGAGLTPMKPQGFDGVGNAFGFRGSGKTHVMVRVSGRNATEFLLKSREYGQEFHPTRIDYQVTANYRTEEKTFASRIHSTVRATERAAGRIKRSKSVLYQGPERDTGISFGERSAETFVRLYHPRTAGHLEYPETALRFEVEYKGNRAEKVYQMAMKADGLQYLAASLVQGELRARGVVEPWYGSQEIPRVKTDYHPTDNAKRFDWFERSVMPCLTKMMQDPRYRDKIHQLYTAARAESGRPRTFTALDATKGEAAYWKAREQNTL